eukprot:scaffold63886_cov42-Prasinocladus_malaysianus.AAC.1
MAASTDLPISLDSNRCLSTLCAHRSMAGPRAATTPWTFPKASSEPPKLAICSAWTAERSSETALMRSMAASSPSATRRWDEPAAAGLPSDENPARCWLTPSQVTPTSSSLSETALTSPKTSTLCLACSPTISSTLASVSCTSSII